MANFQWPTAYLPPWSLKSALKITPPNVLARTDMEAPKARVRRRWTDGLWPYPAALPLSLGQFELFKAIYADPDALDQGANWFDAPIYYGEGYAAAACRFVSPYDATLRGVTWTVAVNLEVEDLKVLTKAEVNARWAGAIP
ncbi:hypothetical protein sos41_31240 [Alphaproteobacteria bacterium SO-S41]|nr:hypothetical protein sos41_31240 [Alphaproteobacteria bacterium SO-S41]